MTIHYNYYEWEKTLKPGDLLLFCMPNNQIGKIIRCCQSHHLNIKSNWGHCGIVCPHNFIKTKNLNTKRTYILESLVSGFDGVKNAETNSIHNGLQIRDLQHVVSNIVIDGGYVACYHLEKPIFKYSIIEERSLNDTELLAYITNSEYTDFIQYFWRKYKSKKYDFCNVCKAININLCISSKNSKKRLFCSEAVIRFYQFIGLIDNKIKPEKISPEEIASWCGDVRGDNPFYSDPDIMSFKN